jgi:hypothetical protein
MSLQAMLSSAEALYRSGQLDDAKRHYREVLAADPNNFVAHVNLGNVLKDRDHYGEAIEHYERAADLRPNSGIYANLLYIYSDLRRDEDARTCYRKSLQLEPDSVLAHYNRSIWLLRNGDFENGWLEYEWRFKAGGHVMQDLPQPRWIGQSLRDKTILLWADQGAGDFVMFIRFAASLKKLGAMIILGVPNHLRPLAALCGGIDQVIGEYAPPDFDYHAPLMSLPAALNITIESIPRSVPYILIDKDRVSGWRQRLGDGLKVGIAWQGSRKYRHDYRRSIPLKHFAPLAMPGVRLISLQKGENTQVASAGFKIETLGNIDREAFIDTVAVMRCLDLVVTSDTSIAHLAGALGVPTWVAIDSMPEWRWLWDRTDSPWYPTMTLWRQKEQGEWTQVFADIVDGIKQRFTL